MERTRVYYVVVEKSTGKYLDDDAYLSNDIGDAYLWIDDEDAEEYIKNIIDEPNDFEVIRVDIKYNIWRD